MTGSDGVRAGISAGVTGCDFGGTGCRIIFLDMNRGGGGLTCENVDGFGEHGVTGDSIGGGIEVRSVVTHVFGLFGSVNVFIFDVGVLFTIDVKTRAVGRPGGVVTGTSGGGASNNLLSTYILSGLLILILVVGSSMLGDAGLSTGGFKSLSFCLFIERSMVVSRSCR